MSEAKDKLILALDVATLDEALKLFESLREEVGMFKIGSQLFTSCGSRVVREIVDAGGRVFLDLKFHDIPNTVAAACREAVKLGVSLLNVHTSGGAEMMMRAADAVRDELDTYTASQSATEASHAQSAVHTKLLGVTVLTSSNEATLKETGVISDVDEQVVRLAKLAWESGLNGVVASPLEISLIRRAISHRDFLIVTPGVRPADSSAHDQKRVLTPYEAVRAGADHIVVGRAIIEHTEPLQIARRIVREIEEALNEGESFEDSTRGDTFVEQRTI